CGRYFGRESGTWNFDYW
nr:immunoglobulin heavy chain junction region [Macaca mulatta]